MCRTYDSLYLDICIDTVLAGADSTSRLVINWLESRSTERETAVNAERFRGQQREVVESNEFLVTLVIYIENDDATTTTNAMQTVYAAGISASWWGTTNLMVCEYVTDIVLYTYPQANKFIQMYLRSHTEMNKYMYATFTVDTVKPLHGFPFCE